MKHLSSDLYADAWETRRYMTPTNAGLRALMRIANGLELELRALKREIEARRDAQVESHERLGNLLETGTLFHHDDRAEAERAHQQSRRAPGD